MVQSGNRSAIFNLVASSVVRLDGHFHDPSKAAIASLSTAFVMENPHHSGSTVLVTNAHCVRPELSQVNVISYASGSAVQLAQIPSTAFSKWDEDEADLAMVTVNSQELQKLAVRYDIPPSKQAVSESEQVHSFGYPEDGTDFCQNRGPSHIDCVVRQGTTEFAKWRRSFFVDGPWGPGRSGSPVFTWAGTTPLLLGVNRGVVHETLNAAGHWESCGLSRVIQVDNLIELLQTVQQ